MEFLISTIVVVIVIYLIVIVIIGIQVALASDIPATQRLADAEDIQTGDILGVGYRHPFGWFVTAWSFSVWSHTGIAWRHPDTNQLFVMEAANYGNKYVGVFRIPFHQWLRINKHSRMCHLRLIHSNKSKEELAKRMDETFKLYENIKLDTFNWEWYRLLQTRPYSDKLQGHYTCYEITVGMLQRLGIVEKKYAGSSYFSRDIIWNHLHMEKGYSYSSPVSLLSPPDIEALMIATS